MIKKNFYITRQQIEALKEESRKTGLSMAELVRRAIDKYLEEKC